MRHIWKNPTLRKEINQFVMMTWSCYSSQNRVIAMTFWIFLKGSDFLKHVTLVSSENTFYTSCIHLAWHLYKHFECGHWKTTFQTKSFLCANCKRKAKFSKCELPLFLPAKFPFREYPITYSNSSRTRIPNAQKVYCGFAFFTASWADNNNSWAYIA